MSDEMIFKPTDEAVKALKRVNVYESVNEAKLKLIYDCFCPANTYKDKIYSHIEWDMINLRLAVYYSVVNDVTEEYRQHKEIRISEIYDTYSENYEDDVIDEPWLSDLVIYSISECPPFYENEEAFNTKKQLIHDTIDAAIHIYTEGAYWKIAQALEEYQVDEEYDEYSSKEEMENYNINNEPIKEDSHGE